METCQKYMLEKFLEHLNTDFEAFCIRHELEKTNSQFITFMIDHDLIAPAHLQRYTICHEFEKIRITPPLTKIKVVGILADRFHMPEKSIWNILKYNKIIDSRSKHKTARLSG